MLQRRLAPSQYKPSTQGEPGPQGASAPGRSRQVTVDGSQYRPSSQHPGDPHRFCRQRCEGPPTRWQVRPHAFEPAHSVPGVAHSSETLHPPPSRILPEEEAGSQRTRPSQGATAAWSRHSGCASTMAPRAPALMRSEYGAIPLNSVVHSCSRVGSHAPQRMERSHATVTTRSKPGLPVVTGALSTTPRLPVRQPPKTTRHPATMSVRITKLSDRRRLY